MQDLKDKLKNQAIQNHGQIYPAGYMTSLDDCFTKEGDRLIFWFNIKESPTTKCLSTTIEE